MGCQCRQGAMFPQETLGNRGTEGLTDILKVKHIEMHKQGKTEALATNTAAAQTPTRHTDPPFPIIFYFPKRLSGSRNTSINIGHKHGKC